MVNISDLWSSAPKLKSKDGGWSYDPVYCCSCTGKFSRCSVLHAICLFKLKWCLDVASQLQLFFSSPHFWYPLFGVFLVPFVQSAQTSTCSLDIASPSANDVCGFHGGSNFFSPAILSIRVMFWVFRLCQCVFGLHVEAISAQCIQHLLCRRVVSVSRRQTYHNVDFASQWFMPSAGRTASQASLLNMTSHFCGHLHHWKAVSTLRSCKRTAVCLRALVFNCLRPDDASMNE